MVKRSGNGFLLLPPLSLEIDNLFGPEVESEENLMSGENSKWGIFESAENLFVRRRPRDGW